MERSCQSRKAGKYISLDAPRGLNHLSSVFLIRFKHVTWIPGSHGVIAKPLAVLLSWGQSGGDRHTLGQQRDQIMRPAWHMRMEDQESFKEFFGGLLSMKADRIPRNTGG